MPANSVVTATFQLGTINRLSDLLVRHTEKRNVSASLNLNETVFTRKKKKKNGKIIQGYWLHALVTQSSSPPCMSSELSVTKLSLAP